MCNGGWARSREAATSGGSAWMLGDQRAAVRRLFDASRGKVGGGGEGAAEKVVVLRDLPFAFDLLGANGVELIVRPLGPLAAAAVHVKAEEAFKSEARVTDFARGGLL